MNTYLLKRFRARAQKEINIRRLPSRKFEVVVLKKQQLGYYFRDWVNITDKDANINFGQTSEIRAKYKRGQIGYNRLSEDDCKIEFRSTNMTYEEAVKEVYKIRRGYVLATLLPEFIQGLGPCHETKW